MTLLGMLAAQGLRLRRPVHVCVGDGDVGYWKARSVRGRGAKAAVDADLVTASLVAKD
jgi:hypothetical protein